MGTEPVMLCKSLFENLKSALIRSDCVNNNDLNQRVCVSSSPVNINSFHQAKCDPGPEQNNMIAEDHDANEESCSQNDGLSRVSIFCLHAKRCLIYTDNNKKKAVLFIINLK